MSNVRSLNRVILIGRVGQEPEIKNIPSIGRDVAKFTLATNEGYMDKSNQWKETTEWHNIVAWGPLAQKVDRSVGKGAMVLIEGKLKTRKWKDQNDQNHQRTEIEVSNLVMLEKSGKGSSYGGPRGSSDSAGKGYNNGYSSAQDQPAPLPEKDISDDDYPFDESNDPF